MSETRHSLEPWTADHSAWGSTLSVGSADCDGQRFSEADARRIVACVNACAGVPTEALEAGALGAALNLLRLIHTHDDEASDHAAVLLRRLGRLP